MRNPFTNFKILLSTLPYDEQINIVNQAISRNYASKIDNRYNRLKELKQIKNRIEYDQSKIS